MFVLLIRLLFFDKLIGGSAILTKFYNIHHTYSTEIKHNYYKNLSLRDNIIFLI